jgi:hypothetical protein
MALHKFCLHCKSLWEPVDAPYCGNCGFHKNVVADVDPEKIRRKVVQVPEKKEVSVAAFAGLKKAKTLLIQLANHFDQVLNPGYAPTDHDVEMVLEQTHRAIREIEEILKAAPPEPAPVPDISYY